MVSIFFDVDGVIADFVGGILKQHNREDIQRKDVRWGLEAQLGIAPADFWHPLGFEFWANLPMLDDGWRFLQQAEWMLGAANIGLLTSPCDTPGCIDGKRKWIKRYFPDYERRTFFGSAKHLFAGPTKILVDDNDDNCRRFMEAGGQTLLVPRPWNESRLSSNMDGSFSLKTMSERLTNVLRRVQGAD